MLTGVGVRTRDMNANMNRHPSSYTIRSLFRGLAAIGMLSLTACGGGDDAGGAAGGAGGSGGAGATGGSGGVGGTSGSGGVGGTSGSGGSDSDRWVGIRLVGSWGNARLQTLDADNFTGVKEVFSTPIPNGLANPGDIDN